jgi:hypothetical protein
LDSRQRYHLRASKTNLWVAPLCCVVCLGVAWAIGRVVTVPVVVYWLIVIPSALIWLGDLIRVITNKGDA